MKTSMIRTWKVTHAPTAEYPAVRTITDQREDGKEDNHEHEQAEELPTSRQASGRTATDRYCQTGTVPGFLIRGDNQVVIPRNLNN